MALTDLKRILGTAKRGAPLVTAGNVPNAADELESVCKHAVRVLRWIHKDQRAMAYLDGVKGPRDSYLSDEVSEAIRDINGFNEKYADFMEDGEKL
jgi:hypothetical protein